MTSHPLRLYLELIHVPASMRVFYILNRVI